MYRIDKSEEAVRELQKNLTLLEESLFSVAPSGVYDSETELAVREFQDAAGLSVTGIADYPTFEGIYERARADEAERERTRKYKGTHFPISLNDGGVEVYNLNVMLSAITSYYGLYYFNEIGSFFDTSSRDAADIAAKLFGYEPTGTVDSLLYERIEREFLSIK
jgi:peptidoglycan hydrolase-like protein with peptidoglycan-binding domain